MNKQSQLLHVLYSLLILVFVPLLYSEEFDSRTLKIADKLRCITCQGLSVKDSNAGLSINMKRQIRRMLEDGKSEEEILNYFEERYTEWVLRSPKKEGFNLLLWLLPGIGLFLSIVLIAFNAHRRTRTNPSNQESLNSEEQKEIERDLNQI